MSNKTKVRTRTQDGLIEVLVLVTHPMETGQRTDKNTKQKIPAHFIKDMTVEHNGKVVATVAMGIGVSENPLISVRLQNAANGDKIKVTWVDNQGQTGDGEAIVEG